MRHVLHPAKISAILVCVVFIITTTLFFNSCKKDSKKQLEDSEIATKKPGTYSVPLYCEDLPNPCSDPACARYYNCNPETVIYYAGVPITLENNGSSKILKFNNIGDVNTILDQLDADYNNYNDNYDNQYLNYDSDQLDSIDAVNNFDEFATFKNFENLFPSFVSKRSQIESAENTWLANNMTGSDPDVIDLTFDDAENAIFNSNYSFKIGSNLYELKPEGFYINGILQDDGGGGAARITTICKSNKKRSEFAEYDNGTKRFKIKVALNSWFVRSSAKGKVVHYKSKNGSWKRSRAKMAVVCGGKLYSNLCTESFTFSERNPAPSGWKNKKQLKIVRRQAGTIWKTNSGELSSAFDTPSGYSAVLPLTF